MIAALPRPSPRWPAARSCPRPRASSPPILYPKVRRADRRRRQHRRHRQGRRHDRAEPRHDARLYSHRSRGAPRRTAAHPRAAPSMRASTPSASTATRAPPTPSRLLSSGRVPCAIWGVRTRRCTTVCRDLAEDVVRNGEGVRHVIRVRCGNAASPRPRARSAKRSSTPALQMRRRRQRSQRRPPRAGHRQARRRTPPEDIDLSRLKLRAMGGIEIFATACSSSIPQRRPPSSPTCAARSSTPANGRPKDGVFAAPVDFPPHERCVEIEIDVGNGPAAAMVSAAISPTNT
jgi:glutamate N-acetyltransferase/amino-acid N-acetyltransferase